MTTKLFEFTTNELSMPLEITNQLSVEWMVSLSTDQLAFTQQGSSGAASSKHFSFGDPNSDHFVLNLADNFKWSIASTKGIAEEKIKELSAQARAKTLAGEYGTELVYQLEMTASAWGMDPVNMNQMARVLGDQVRIAGWRRLGDWALLEFVPDPADADKSPIELLFPSSTTIKVTLFVPGPTNGTWDASLDTLP